MSTPATLVWQMWEKVCAEETFSNVTEPMIVDLCNKTRKLLADHGWPLDLQNKLFQMIATTLREKTMGHPTTLLTIRVLESEAHFDA
jgi:hypothetical protein